MGVIQSPFMSDKFAVYVKLTAPEGKGDELVAAFSELYPGPLDAEPGTELHIIHQAVDNPDVVFFYELYTDKVFAGLIMVILIGLAVESFVLEALERATVRRWGMQR